MCILCKTSFLMLWSPWSASLLEYIAGNVFTFSFSKWNLVTSWVLRYWVLFYVGQCVNLPCTYYCTWFYQLQYVLMWCSCTVCSLTTAVYFSSVVLKLSKQVSQNDTKLYSLHWVMFISLIVVLLAQFKFEFWIPLNAMAFLWACSILWRNWEWHCTCQHPWYWDISRETKILCTHCFQMFGLRDKFSFFLSQCTSRPLVHCAASWNTVFACLILVQLFREWYCVPIILVYHTVVVLE